MSKTELGNALLDTMRKSHDKFEKDQKAQRDAQIARIASERIASLSHQVKTIHRGNLLDLLKVQKKVLSDLEVDVLAAMADLLGVSREGLRSKSYVENREYDSRYEDYHVMISFDSFESLLSDD